MAEKVRLSLELSKETDAFLRSVAEERGISRSEALRRAIALLEASLVAAKEGLKVGFVDGEGTLRREVVGF